MAACLALLLLVVLPPYNESSAQQTSEHATDIETLESESDQAVADDMVQQATTNWRVSEDEAVSRLDRQYALLEVNEAAQESYPDTFGGLWVDHSSGGRAYVQFTEDAEQSYENVIDGYEAELLAEPRTVGVSLRHLLSRNADILAMRAEHEDEFGPIDVSVDIPTNSIVLEVRPLTEHVEHRLKEHFGQDVEVRERQHPVRTEEDQCSATACAPPLRGGIEDVNTTRGRAASFGFMASNSSGTRYALVAGHHGFAGNSISHNGTVVGGIPTGGSVDTGNVDAARVYINNPSYWSQPSRWVRHNAGTTAFSIASRNTIASNAFVGLMLCRTGRSYAGSCGTVSDVFASPSSLTSNTNLLEMEDACAESGDSGGPYYTRLTNNGVSQGRAFGMHVTSSSDSACFTSGELVYASHLQYIQDALNVTVNIS